MIPKTTHDLRKVHRAGKCMAVTLPHSFCKKMAIEQGAWLEFTVKGDHLVICKVRPAFLHDHNFEVTE